MRNLSFCSHFLCRLPRAAFLGVTLCGPFFGTVASRAQETEIVAPAGEDATHVDSEAPDFTNKEQRRYSAPLPLPEEDELTGDDIGREGEFRGQGREATPDLEANARKQQRELQREQREMGLRRLMVSLGVDERGSQDEVMSFITRETRARAQVKRASNKLYELMNARAASDTQIASALKTYRDALKNERERRTQSENELDERLDFRNQPRLEAFLTLSGLIGDGPLALPFNARRPPTLENRAYASKRPKPKDAAPEGKR